MKDNMEKSIGKEISKYSPNDIVKIDFAILSGDPTNVIVDCTEKNKIDLVIMGNKGLQGLAKFKGLGSVSRKVSEAVSCPITIIR
jgi:nucleotide-binding universal stress UspA family protein